MMRMHLPLHSFRRHVPRGLQFRVGGEGHFPCGRLASSHGCGGVPPRPLAGLEHIYVHAHSHKHKLKSKFCFVCCEVIFSLFGFLFT